MDKMKIQLAAWQYRGIFGRENCSKLVLPSSGSNLPHIQSAFGEVTIRTAWLKSLEQFLSGTSQ